MHDYRLIAYILAALIARPDFWWFFPAIYDDPGRTAFSWWKMHWPQYCEGFRHTFLIALVIIASLSVNYPFYRSHFSAEDTHQYLLHLFLPILLLSLSWGASQLLYGIAFLAEILLRPADLNRFRILAYQVTFWFSRALPFLALARALKFK